MTEERVSTAPSNVDTKLSYLDWRKWLRPVLIGLIALALNIDVYLFQFDYSQLGAYAYVGVFLVTLIGNATTLVPVPYILIVACIAGQTDNLPMVILAGALGSVLGESVAFFIGRSGRGIVEDTRFYAWVQRQMRYPWRAFIVLFVLATPPNPAFDVAGLTAGALGVPYWVFFSAVFLGRVVRIGLLGIAGHYWCNSYSF